MTYGIHKSRITRAIPDIHEIHKSRITKAIPDIHEIHKSRITKTFANHSRDLPSTKSQTSPNRIGWDEFSTREIRARQVNKH